MSTTASKHEHTFQAEIKQLLHLLSHSLYQSRDIALRELISNASDALDKMRHIALSDPAHKDTGELAVELIIDKDAHTLTIADNGIGMTEDEVVKNLGTIARSGSLEWLQNLTGDAKKDVNLIGQFGVGFYSAFMLADTVEVRTRSYKETTGWVWESEGTGSFSVAPAGEMPRGTQVILHLKKDLPDYTSEPRLKTIVETYSTFIPYPIKLGGKTINEMKPIWVEPKSQLTEEQYAGFYQYLSHRTEEKPIWHLHSSADSPIQFHALLYCPPSNPERMGFGRIEHGLHLCAKRILVQDDCRELLPEYLRFLYGVVDSEDLPLNVSRETLQDNTVFQKIRKVLVRKILERIADLAKDEPEKFKEFYSLFGNALKEGVGTDYESRDKLAALLRFHSTKTEGDAMVSLDEYVERVKIGQKRIYFLSGPDLASIRKNPHLEIFRKRDMEVLLLPEPIDEWSLSNLFKYREFELQSIDSADLGMPEESEKIETPPAATAGFDRVVEIVKKRLGAKVQEVRKSDRLVDSPACLVSPDGGFSAQMQKIMMMHNKDFQVGPRILELNPSAPLIRRLCELSSNPQQEDFIGKVGEQLYDSSLLLEGMLTEPMEMAARVQAFMEEAAKAKSSIIV